MNETVKLCNTQTNCNENHHKHDFCSLTETQPTVFGNNSIPWHATQVTEIKSGDTCYPNNRKNITWKDTGKRR